MTKPAITTRLGKGEPLTFTEMDTNLGNLQDAVITLSGDSGTSQDIELNATATVSGGTGISTVAGDTNTLTVNLDDTTVSAGSFTNADITVDAQGRITAASNGTLYTDVNARNAISAGTGLSYDSGTGVMSSDITQYTDTNARSAVSGGTGISYNSSTGVITVDTATIATQNYVDTQVSNLVENAPETLDTLNELAAALNDDPNFATTISNQIGTKIGFTDLSVTTNPLGETAVLGYDDTTGVFTFTPVDTSDLIGLNDLSVNTGANSGSGSLSYNSTTGEFNFNPADLSSFLTSETFTELSQDTTPQLGGNLDGQGNKIEDVEFDNYKETIHNLGSTDTPTIDVANGNVQKVTISSSLLLPAFTNAEAGQSVTLIVSGSGTASGTPAYSFAGGLTDLTTSSIVSIFYDGTDYYASISTDFQ